MTSEGLVMASDCRTNSGTDQANIVRKMYSFVQPGKRVFILLASGNLSLTQSVITLLRQDFNEGRGLGASTSLYAAARVVGDQIRRVAHIDAAALRRDSLKFNVQFILGGQVPGEKPGLYMVYSQGNPLHATKDTCFLLSGEGKYGKPILDRGITYDGTPLAEAAPLDTIEFVRTIAVARITMARSMVRLSAGRETMSEEAQALCFLAGANSVFCGPKLLTTPNPERDRDLALMDRLGLQPMG